MNPPVLAVVIPCYRVARALPAVLRTIPITVRHIIVVDDACPEHSGKLAETAGDPRIRVLRHDANQGVGGATITGYRAALATDATIIVKLDGDGQMDAALIPRLIAPIARGEADYAKGNRFFYPAYFRLMPATRRVLNAVLSFVTKLSTGYWPLFDPTNGFTAIHRTALSALPLSKIARRFFFESDMLYQLNLLQAVAVDVPMKPNYGDEHSNVRLAHNIGPFAAGHLRNFCKRVVYQYYLRNFSIASVFLLAGMGLSLFGLLFGLHHWHLSLISGQPATAGTVMLAAFPLLTGIQFLLSFLQYDISAVPRTPLHLRITEHDAQALAQDEPAA